MRMKGKRKGSRRKEKEERREGGKQRKLSIMSPPFPFNYVNRGNVL